MHHVWSPKGLERLPKSSLTIEACRHLLFCCCRLLLLGCIVYRLLYMLHIPAWSMRTIRQKCPFYWVARKRFNRGTGDRRLTAGLLHSCFYFSGQMSCPLLPTCSQPLGTKGLVGLCSRTSSEAAEIGPGARDEPRGHCYLLL